MYSLVKRSGDSCQEHKGAVVIAENLSPILCSVMGNTEQKVSKGTCLRKKRIPFSSEYSLTHFYSFKVTANTDFKVLCVSFINDVQAKKRI